MDLKFYLSQLSPQYYGDLTVDDTPGGWDSTRPN